jgi:hypothetical protein
MLNLCIVRIIADVLPVLVNGGFNESQDNSNHHYYHQHFHGYLLFPGIKKPGRLFDRVCSMHAQNAGYPL